MKLLQNLLRRESERLSSPIYREYANKLRGEEPVQKLLVAAQAAVSRLNAMLSSQNRAVGASLDAAIKEVADFYGTDREHDIAQSWSKKTYDELLEATRRVSYVHVEQSGHHFEFYGGSGPRIRVELRQPYIQVNNKRFGPDSEMALRVFLNDALTEIRDANRDAVRRTPWSTRAYTKIQTVVKQMKWATIQGPGCLRFTNPAGKVCVISLEGEKVYMNYEGKTGWFTDEDALMEAVATVLDTMRPWSYKYFDICLQAIRFVNLPFIENDGHFEFGTGEKCIVRRVGEKISLEFRGKVKFYDSDHRQLATDLGLVVSAMKEPKLLLLTLKTAIESLSELRIVQSSDTGFSFTAVTLKEVSVPEVSVKLDGNHIVISGQGTELRYNEDEATQVARAVADHSANLILLATKAGYKISWSRTVFQSIKTSLVELPLWDNMQRFVTEDSVTIELKDRTHGFRVTIDEDAITIVHDGTVSTFRRNSETKMLDYLGVVMENFTKHGKKN